MSGLGVGALGPGGTPPLDDEQRLRQAAKQMEGVFVEQLYKAMRETVPEGGLIDGGAGEEMFSGLLDQHLATLTPQRWESGLGAALYRQLRGKIAAAEAAGDIPSVGGER